MSLSGCPTTGFMPPQDKAVQNAKVNDTLVARKIVSCSLTAGVVEVDNLIVNNAIIEPSGTNGVYTPIVVFQTGFTAGPSALEATFNTVGRITNVSGRASVTTTAGPSYFTITLPTPQAFSIPIGVVTFVQDPPTLNTTAGCVSPLNTATPNVAEISFAPVGGISGIVVFVFSYQSSL